MTKTNAMRLLERAGLEFRVVEYDYDENDLNGMHVCTQTGMPPEQVFKTLVARGDKRGFLVFCIPVCCELDLRKAAKAAGDKRVELIHVRELLGVTGYIRGGCSPVGMKKQYPTYIDETAVLHEEIAVSGGARGVQIVTDPTGLMTYVGMQGADLTL